MLRLYSKSKKWLSALFLLDINFNLILYFNILIEKTMNSLPLCIIAILLSGASAQIGYNPEPDNPATATPSSASSSTTSGISTSDTSNTSSSSPASSSSSSPLSSIGGVGGLAAITVVLVVILGITCLLCRRRHMRVLEIESSHASSRPRHTTSKSMMSANVMETYPLPLYQGNVGKDGSVRIDM